jgi:hypothetical protein
LNDLQELNKTASSQFELKNKNFDEQLRKINILFDEKAEKYETIDFNELLSLLEKVKEESKESTQKKIIDQMKLQNQSDLNIIRKSIDEVRFN